MSRNNYLAEAFKSMRSDDILNEEAFTLDSKGADELKQFLDGDEMDDSIQVIDTDAETPEELEDSYIGKVILDCCVCHSKLYKDKEDVVIDEDGDLANVDEECPFCYCVDGFKIVGEVKEFNKDDSDEDEKGDEEDDDEKDEVEVEETEEDEKIEESVSAKRSARMKKKCRSIKESSDGGKYFDNIAKHFYYTDNTDFLDLVGRIVSNIDFSSSDIDAEVLDAVNDGLTYFDDQWEILKEYSETPADANYDSAYNEFLDDMYFLAKEIAEDNDASSDDDEDDGENESLKEDKKLREAPNYELRPQYDSRKSFYGKARVDTGDNDDKNKLFSYDTLVAEIKDGKPVVYGAFSATTLRHIKDWLKQNGFKAENKAQILRDYGVKEEAKKCEGDKCGGKCRKHDIKRIEEGWRGSDEIEVVSHGEWADPDLVYKDYTFNYWDIEDALWDNFLEETGHKDSESEDPKVEAEFDKYVQDNAVGYLEDCIAFGYFKDGKKSWRKDESKKVNEAFYDTTRVLEIVSPRTRARLKRVIDTQKKYGNDMEISVIVDSPYKAHLTYGEGGADYYKDEDGKWKHDIGYIKIDSALADAIISDVCKAVGMCEKMNESVEEVKVTTETDEVNVKTEDGKVTVETQKREDETKKDEEVIEPVSDEVRAEIEDDSAEAEIGDEIDVEMTDFDEESFDELGEAYLKKAYSNVESYKSVSATANDNRITVEGVIKFKSGNEKKTKFVLESKEVTKSGKSRFVGENLQIAKGKKAFTVFGTLSEGRFVTESLGYDYRAKDKNGKSKRISGTVTKR